MIKPEVFRQYDIRGIVGEEIDEESFYLIGKGFGTYLREKGLSSLVLGGDARLTTPVLKESFTRGALETGCTVIDLGMVATPVLYFSIWKFYLNFVC